MEGRQTTPLVLLLQVAGLVALVGVLVWPLWRRQASPAAHLTPSTIIAPALGELDEPPMAERPATSAKPTHQP